jgi:hypothetical protein
MPSWFVLMMQSPLQQSALALQMAYSSPQHLPLELQT